VASECRGYRRIAASALFAAVLDHFVPQPANNESARPAVAATARGNVDGGKTFHVPGCPFMHGKYHMVTPEEAVNEGYAPCNVACTKRFEAPEILSLNLKERKLQSVWWLRNDGGPSS